MDRSVRQIHPEDAERESASSRRFSQYLTHRNIVLLGDPGAGKSHTFEQQAKMAGGRFLRARSFLTAPVRNTGEILFIDGLDERRGGRSDRATIDALAAKLIEADPSAVRISCRVADWLGKSDLVSLEPFFEERGGSVVLVLEALAPAERLAVLTNNGTSSEEAASFLHEAEKRGLTEFLDNPQNLIMLGRAVQSGTWPATRRDLFEMATALMLQEQNSEYARTEIGGYPGEELRLPAGAAFAVRLISDIDSISLTDQEGSKTVPSYRSLPFFDRDKTLAALGRRVFVAGPEMESVDYAHRTTAEYLGAAWLAEAVRAGLPIGRVIALMGVDGHPAPELRGLHAWLAVHLPEHAERLIDADPYGVLTYGDAASLNRSLCAGLIRSLGRLSQVDPWFRKGGYGAPAIAGLARRDMADEFRALLQSPDTSIEVRGVVIEALAQGAPLPDLCDDLTYVLVTKSLQYLERLDALTALLRLGDKGEARVVNACRTLLGTDRAALAIRAQAIERLYGAPFGPADVAHLTGDLLSSGIDAGSNILWALSSHLPLSDLPAILDAIRAPARDVSIEPHNIWAVSAFFERLLLRVLEAPVTLEAPRILAWLRNREDFSIWYSGLKRDELRAALCARPGLLDEMVAHLLKTIAPDDNPWYELSRFQETVLSTINPDQIIRGLQIAMTGEPVGSERELLFYEMSLRLSYQLNHKRDTFERLFAYADTRSDLATVRARAVSSIIPDWRLEMNERRAAHKKTKKYDPEGHRRNFERDTAEIAKGGHLGWLDWVAKVYLGDEVDHVAAPEARLVSVLGEDHATVALNGLVAALGRTDSPSLQQVIDFAVQNQWIPSWRVYIAGLNELFRRTSGLEGVSDDLLSAMLALDLTAPVFQRDGNAITCMQHPWKQALLRERPDLVRFAYESVARGALGSGAENVSGMHELISSDDLSKFRQGVVFDLLRDFPNANATALRKLLLAALGMPSEHAALLTLSDRILCGDLPVNQPQHDSWLATAWLLAPERYGAALQDAAQNNPDIVFDLRDFANEVRDDLPYRLNLSLDQIEFLIKCTASLYPPAGYPSDGWGGNRNAWDATDYVRSLINRLSANTTSKATEALSRLGSDPALASYRPEIQHALANQRARRRETEYERPNWSQTLRALDNKQPATAADLHAVLVAHLEDLKKRVRTENTDMYRMFWNLDGHGRLKEPQPEEACRDYLITLLRPRLSPLGIAIEPESHMAGDRRADISATIFGRKIPCEIKRDYHAEVWTALDSQLERFYAHDPEARGFGIYLVFWFGDNRPSPLPLSPGGRTRPQSALEMEAMLRAGLPDERAARTAVIVIDVTKPD